MPVAEDFRTWVRCPPPPPFRVVGAALRARSEALEGGFLSPARLSAIGRMTEPQRLDTMARWPAALLFMCAVLMGAIPVEGATPARPAQARQHERAVRRAALPLVPVLHAHRRRGGGRAVLSGRPRPEGNSCAPVQPGRARPPRGGDRRRARQGGASRVDGTGRPPQD